MAYATKPQIHSALLERFGRHPLRVLNERKCTFTNADTGDFEVNAKNLRTFVSEPATASPPTQLKATWQLTPEFIPTRPGRIADDKGNIFQRIDDNEARYVCVRSGSNSFCERTLVTDQKGILEIPLKKEDWSSGSKITVALRDYKILEAEDDFEPDKHNRFKVTLIGNPQENKWTLTSDSVKQEFADSLDLEVSRWYGMFTRLFDGLRGEVEFTLWAVRKVVECSSAVRTQSVNRPAGTTVRGVVIHYNSGYYVSEKRGTGTVLCRNVFDDSAHACRRDNDYLCQPELCLQILKKIYTNGLTGYHYHIDRSGEIVWVVDEDKRCYHSGKSREPNSITARVPNESGTTTTQNHTRTSSANKLDDMYIGINLTGYHTPAEFHFTDNQVWYLDRLLENIRERRSDVVWYNILGHDEVRAAYKAQYPNSNKPDKPDPGAALPGGMLALRGRHYA